MVRQIKYSKLLPPQQQSIIEKELVELYTVTIRLNLSVRLAVLFIPFIVYNILFENRETRFDC